MLLNQNYRVSKSCFKERSNENLNFLIDESKRSIGGLSKKGCDNYYSYISENESIS